MRSRLTHAPSAPSPWIAQSSSAPWIVACSARASAALSHLRSSPAAIASRTLKSIDAKGVTLLSGDLGRAVSTLKHQPGKEIGLFGGANLCASLLELGLVDVLEIATIPVVLGRGIPLIAPLQRRRELKLEEQRAFRATGTLLLTYRVAA